MASSNSAWRANDVVAYEAMRDAANKAIALLLRARDDAGIRGADTTEEAADIRREMLEVDGYDRAAVDVFRNRLDDRIAEVSTDTG